MNQNWLGSKAKIDRGAPGSPSCPWQGFLDFTLIRVKDHLKYLHDCKIIFIESLVWHSYQFFNMIFRRKTIMLFKIWFDSEKGYHFINRSKVEKLFNSWIKLGSGFCFILTTYLLGVDICWHLNKYRHNVNADIWNQMT